MLLLTGQVWVSPGQWGRRGVLRLPHGLRRRPGRQPRARARDVTLAFLAFYCGLIFGRSLWLGEPMTIPLHRLESGALLLFAFFMISDPKTTPDSRAGRVLFAALVALGACVRAVPAVPDERPALVAGGVLARSCRSSTACCPARATRGPAAARSHSRKELAMKRSLVAILLVLVARALVH